MSNLLKFQIFYNGQEKYDNILIIYDKNTKEWSNIKTSFNTGVFGNFWPHKKKRSEQENLELKIKIYDKEYTFTSSEVAFQASKCKNVEDIELFTKTNIHSLDSFRLGRKIKLRSDWEEEKIKIMLYILECKFTQYEDLKKILIDTCDAYLIEHTPVKNRDKFWADDNDGTGKNKLGLCLMTIRKKIGGSVVNNECIEMLPELYKYLSDLQ